MSHTIKVFIVDGSLVYIHHDSSKPTNDEPGNHLLVPPSEKVDWTSSDGNISIDFTSSPFKSGNLHLQANQGKKTKVETILKPALGVGGRLFKYSATVGAVTDDPDIIIDDTSGGGKKKKKAAKAKPAKSKKKK
jgi:hypothetical protein